MRHGCVKQRTATFTVLRVMAIASGDNHRSVRGHEAIAITLNTVNVGVRCFTQPCRTFRNYVQHRLNVGWRAGNDAENLARRCLLFQSFGEITVAFLQFLEQPHVLDGDHGLVSKRLNQLDLPFRKRFNDITPYDDGRQLAFLLATVVWLTAFARQSARENEASGSGSNRPSRIWIGLRSTNARPIGMSGLADSGIGA